MKRGEIWLIDFDPSRGKEQKKVRPALIIGSDHLNGLPIRIILPITGTQRITHVAITASQDNGLIKDSFIDTVQIKSFSNERLIKKMGVIDNMTFAKVLAKVSHNLGLN
ncbi:type II toxin-antitoxin system PemK/MazF family toxin [Flammeovirga yaeyamensis]|uniref:mRNA interferase n=1 Tax=Flammeovirga yaeyamensis TaxID=367791 RepID=A0AAX1NAY2_9BACT|nr:type II toxin-antitoxin system PemK/MazF family toxin [Flammeovirga yaeyamensis]MBB3698995.1 mRNA interferase MazF [Flammeovirga yaeyamensis]NMF36429.1 type II toxin-antitoxin system PemK/MazF family toxin [Flammeovirga yaeyamensis]QWG03611.1 type II toxin-antitoxin system PemK/MazF family toxin [Flammeovirga yaeyamensis]